MRTWVLVGAALLALLVVANAGQRAASGPAPAASGPAPAATAAPAHADQAGYPYPPDVEAAFRRNFADSPGMGDCALRETERRYSYDDFVSISHAYGGTGTLPPSLRAIVQACALSLQ